MTNGMEKNEYGAMLYPAHLGLTYPDNTNYLQKRGDDQVGVKDRIGQIVYNSERNKKSKELWIIIEAHSNRQNDYYSLMPRFWDVVLLSLENGSKITALYSDLEFVPQSIINKRIKDVKEANEALLTKPYLKPNSLCELKYNTEIQIGGFFFSFTETLLKGTIGVIDTNSAVKLTGEIDKNESPETKELFNKLRNEHYGQYYMNDLCFPWVSVYFPEHDLINTIPYQNIQERTFDEKIMEKIVLPKDYFKRIFSITQRVLNVNAHHEIYNELGLAEFCQKGKGAIFLLYGPPGTGKTFTVEAVAEKLQKPLIKVSLGNVFNSQQIMDHLKRSFQKAKKYNAILLLDEIDVFIKKRGDNPMFDENTAIFLKSLEYYDGILFMTTNLVNQIDTAIFSRVHSCLEYTKQDSQSRMNIWKSMLRNDLLKYVAGTPEQHEEMFKQLADININGREIKNSIQNAVSHAIAELNGRPLPNVKWIPKHYFINEANEIYTQREGLKGL